MVYMGRRITHFFFQEKFERMPELLRDVGKSDVLHAFGAEKLLQVQLRGLRLAVRGS